MKRNDTIKRLALALLLVSLTDFAARGFAEEPVSQSPDTNLPRVTKPPKPSKTLKQIWTEIMAKRDGMAKTIAAKRLEPEVETLATDIANLARQLPDRSRNLPPEKMDRLKKALQDIQQLSSDLDSTADKNDQAGTQAHARRLDQVLDSIAALYPTGALPERPSIQIGRAHV